MTQGRIAEGEHIPEQAAPSQSGPSALKIAMERASALYNFYRAERQGGADPLTANERMHQFAKRLDQGQPFVTVK